MERFYRNLILFTSFLFTFKTSISQERLLQHNTKKDTISYVKIGNQIWSSANLNVTKYKNGDIIPQVTDFNVWKNLSSGAWCWYQNDSITYGSIYGRLYNWYAVNDPRGLAPKGWHIPSISEWNKLIKFIDASADTTADSHTVISQKAGALKDTGTRYWQLSNREATNSSGFTALPGGARKLTAAGYGYIKYQACWWSSDPYKINGVLKQLPWAAYVILSYDNWFRKDDFLRTTGLSIRLVKD